MIKSYQHDIHMFELIKKYRLYNNLSQQKIADLIGVPRSRYQKWEDGVAMPKHEDSLKVDKFLSSIKDKIPFINTVGEPDSSKEYGKPPPSREEDLLLVIKNLEARVKDKEEIISLMRDKISKAETIEKLFISALHSPRTLKEFHSLIESSFV